MNDNLVVCVRGLVVVEITSIIATPSACLMFCRWLKGGSFRRDLGKEHFRTEEMKITKMKVIIRGV